VVGDKSGGRKSGAVAGIVQILRVEGARERERGKRKEEKERERKRKKEKERKIKKVEGW
jgi:hypothetical protein